MRRVREWLARPSPVGAPYFDLLLAGALTLYAQLTVWTDVIGDQVTGQRLVPTAGLFLATAPLVWRRRRPLAVLCVVMVAIALEAVLTEAAPEGGQVLFPILVALYSVAAYADRTAALVGLGVAWVATMIHGAYDPEIVSFGELVLVDIFFFWFLGGGVWLAGRYVRSRRHELSDYAIETARLERDRDERARAAVAEERSRIARELHDVVAHGVSVMGVQAAAAEQVMETDPERARESLRTIQTAARDAIAELRQLLGLLRDADTEPARTPQPGLSQLDDLIDQVRAGGLDVELSVEADGRPLPAGVELAAYRIVQEALTNSLKHAGPVKAHVCVRQSPQALDIEVTDDGSDVTASRPAAASAGHGLVGMRERVALYGGTLEVGPRGVSGYSVHARLPLELRA